MPHVVIEGPHHLRGPGYQRYLQAAPDQGFRHLQAYVAPAHDNSPFCASVIQDSAQLDTALQGIHSADGDGVSAGKVRADRHRAGGYHELIIGFPRHAATLQVTYPHLSRRRIDLFNFVEDSDINSIPGPELFRSADNECLFPVDNPADIVGNPSGRK